MTRQRTDSVMTRRCPICSSEGRELYKWTPPYTLNHCPSCQCLFSNPMPTDEELVEFYQGFLYRQPKLDQLEAAIEQKKAELVRLFGDRVMPGRRFLDYGAGTGVASLAAARLGLDVTMYEIDRDAIDWVLSLDKKVAMLACSDKSELSGSTFDLILADNVIEHVREPADFLEELFGYLAPEGLLVAKTPRGRNSELLFHPLISVLQYLLRIYRHNGLGSTISAAWFRPWSLDPPRHLYSFSPESLMRLADKADFDHSELGSYRIPLWEYSLIKRLSGISSPIRKLGLSVVLLPFVALEIASKIVEWLLRSADLLSPGGIFLKVRRDLEPRTLNLEH